jgi:hypothetical protein
MMLSTIQFEVLLALAEPILGLGAIEFWKIKFRQLKTLEPIVIDPSTPTMHTMVDGGCKTEIGDSGWEISCVPLTGNELGW